MTPTRIVALLAVLPAILAKPMTDWPFALQVMRYKSRDCGDNLSMEGPMGGVHIKQGTCHTWDDDKNFPSFVYSWEQYTTHQHMRSDRDCAVLVYEKKHCHGHLLFVNDKINDPGVLGKHADCWHWDGIPGMSIKVKCRVKVFKNTKNLAQVYLNP
ncbi:unnamed protein product [Zymoseptoria tritici ST99CH_3D1]|nr:unnamed protein product [Zymoseptoria tritici ST99CH_3D1]